VKCSEINVADPHRGSPIINLFSLPLVASSVNTGKWYSLCHGNLIVNSGQLESQGGVQHGVLIVKRQLVAG